MAEKVKVAVRVRPMNRREMELGTKCVVDMDKEQTVVYHPKTPGLSGPTSPKSTKESHHKHTPKTFAFDRCFWSLDDTNKEKFEDQDTVFDCLGTDVLGRSFEGYNACIFAYGQTGSGKSYTMMGTRDNKGIIPRLCDTLFDMIASRESDTLAHKVEVSYMEIYNEKVHDLLDPNSKKNLKVREHKSLGPYVDGLSQLAVNSFQDIETLMIEGNKSRTVAATNMNSESSRSHAVFTIIVTQTLTDLRSGVSGEKVSKMSLVDLAGSERAQKTGAMGDRLKEGSNINKSLTTLGLVIKALAESAASSKKKGNFVPYRDSTLTWLLKDNLGGNSKTVMVATISPAADNYEETMSTLRYADSAKRIMNHAVVNEDPNARIIRELRDEVDILKQQLMTAQGKAPTTTSVDVEVDLKERLEEREKLVKEMSKTWEEKLSETEKIHKERHAALESMGISVETSGIKVESAKGFLVNLNADPSLNELLVYYLKDAVTRIGTAQSELPQDIQLHGLGILPEHCVIEVIDTDATFVIPKDGAKTFVNGTLITEKTRVRHGDRLLWGNNHFFRINCPRRETGSMTVSQESELSTSVNNGVAPPLALRSGSSGDTTGYDQAQEELARWEMHNDPIQEAIGAIEHQLYSDKQAALEAQRQMYEEQLQTIRHQLGSPAPHSAFHSYQQHFSGFHQSPGLGGQPGQGSSWAHLAAGSPTGGGDRLQKRIQQMAQDRNDLLKQSLARLREEIIKANNYMREANGLAAELKQPVQYAVTLQIPACNLSANRRGGTFVSEPAIQARHRKTRKVQVLSMDAFDHRLVDMRDMYEEYLEKGPLMDRHTLTSSEGESLPSDSSSLGNPFTVGGDNHDLIGVANVFLDALFYEATLSYPVAIINQHGEVAGRLHVELSKVEGSLGDYSDASSMCSSTDSSSAGSNHSSSNGTESKHITVKVSIKAAKGLPPSMANFVFCQYTFWDHQDLIIVPPIVDESAKRDAAASGGATIKFSHEKEFKATISEDFVEWLCEGALSVEVYGHKTPGSSPWDGLGAGMGALEGPGKPLGMGRAAMRTLADRWSEVSRKLEMWVEIQEMSDAGQFESVEVQPKPDVFCGGVYQLRQGHTRRVVVRLRSLTDSGSLPLSLEAIHGVAVGGLSVRTNLHRGLDSYEEHGLDELRERWMEALVKRKIYLEQKMQRLAKMENKTEDEKEREGNLMDQWVALTDERNAVSVPLPGSGVPGAPAQGKQTVGMEQHVPVLFLDLDVEGSGTSRHPRHVDSLLDSTWAIGEMAMLEREQGTAFVNLPIVNTTAGVTTSNSSGLNSAGTAKEEGSLQQSPAITVTTSWDSSIHESVHLNRVTPSNERVYLVVKAYATLSHPAPVEIVLRKRVCVSVYKKQSMSSKLRKRIMQTSGGAYYGVGRLLQMSDALSGSGLVCDVVAHVPKASEELEDRETMAQLAAQSHEAPVVDDETYMEKYIKSVTAVETIMTRDRLGQEVAIKESLVASGRPTRVNSSPNISSMMKSSDSTFSISSSKGPASLLRVSGSFQDISKHLSKTVSDSAAVPASDRHEDAGGSGHSREPYPSSVSPTPAAAIKKVTTPSSIENHSSSSQQLTTPSQASHPNIEPCASGDNTGAEDVIMGQTPSENIVSQPNDTDNDRLIMSQSLTNDSLSDVRASSPSPTKMAAIGGSENPSAPVMATGVVPTGSMTSSGYGSQVMSSQNLMVTSSAEEDEGEGLVSADYILIEGSSEPELAASMGAVEGSCKESGGADSEVHNISSHLADDELGGEKQQVSPAATGSEAGGSEQTDVRSVVVNEGAGAKKKRHVIKNPFMADTDEENFYQPMGGKWKSLADITSEESTSVHLSQDKLSVESKSPPVTPPHGTVTSLNLRNDNCRLNESAGSDCLSPKSVTSEEALTPRAGRAYESNSQSATPTRATMGGATGRKLMLENEAYSDTNDDDDGDDVGTPTASNEAMDDETKSPFNNGAGLRKGYELELTDASLRSESGYLGVAGIDLSGVSTSGDKKSHFDEHEKSRLDLQNDMYSIKANEDLDALEGWGCDGSSSVTEDDEGSQGLSYIDEGEHSGVSGRGDRKSRGEEIGTEDSISDIDTDDAVSFSSFGSRADLCLDGADPPPPWVQLGVGVLVLSTSDKPEPPKKGVVLFKGETTFAPGHWVGIRLDEANGKNDGSVKGTRYFQCRARYGTFVRHDRLFQDRKRPSEKVQPHPVASLTLDPSTASNIQTTSSHNNNNKNSSTPSPLTVDAVAAAAAVASLSVSSSNGKSAAAPKLVRSGSHHVAGSPLKASTPAASSTPVARRSSSKGGTPSFMKGTSSSRSKKK